MQVFIKKSVIRRNLRERKIETKLKVGEAHREFKDLHQKNKQSHLLNL